MIYLILSAWTVANIIDIILLVTWAKGEGRTNPTILPIKSPFQKRSCQQDQLPSHLLMTEGPKMLYPRGMKNGFRLQVAQFSAELGQYGEAIGIYEDVAKRCVDNNLLKYSAKGYLLNAGICHLCGELPPLHTTLYPQTC